jgi:hypothetical protein
MKAVWSEVRRAFRMTFIDGFAALREGKRHHPGWYADRHLRRGFFVAALPLFVLLLLLGPKMTIRRSSISAEFGFGLGAALLANVVWFSVAAFSRLKAKD